MTKDNEFSKWVNTYEEEVIPSFNKRLLPGGIIPENLDSNLLQHYVTYKINKSNQQLVKVTWILAIITALIGILNLIAVIAR